MGGDFGGGLGDMLIRSFVCILKVEWNFLDEDGSEDRKYDGDRIGLASFGVGVGGVLMIMWRVSEMEFVGWGRRVRSLTMVHGRVEPGDF